MIEDVKKLNPFIGIAIGVILIFFGIFGILILFGDRLSEFYYILAIIPFVIPGIFFLVLNASYLGIRMLATKIDESAELMNPKTSLHGTCAITKVRDLYILKFSDRYLHVIKMNDRTNVSATWSRRIFGPKLPTGLPIKCPVVTEFNGFKIRKCEGKAVLYDIDENQWISGQATMFSIFFFSKSMTSLLYPDVFQNLINLIDH